MKHFLLLLVMTIGLVSSTRATVYYVDSSKADNNGAGTSWATAKKDLQAALNGAVTGDQVWVKAGIYKPTLDRTGNVSPTDSRTKTFYLTSKDVKVYGGFAGGETMLSQRSATTNLTVLSGDLDNNGTSNDNDAYNVFYLYSRTGNCIIDGFTISGGRANVSSSNNYGGGIRNEFGSPSVNNCIFRGNVAISGAALSNYYGNSQITSCTFTGNSSSSSGGGMYNQYSTPLVSNCIFSNDTANSGGGLFNSYSNITLSNCTFNNDSANYGGAMTNFNSSPLISNCTFTTNIGRLYGGGIYNFYNSTSVVSNCTFNSNKTSSYGAGIYNASNSNSTISRCIFSVNAAGSGGGIYNDGTSNGSISNCIFNANTASDYGGGMYNSNSSPTVSNCIFTTNTATNAGGALSSSSGNPVISNCTFYSNSVTDASGVGGGIYYATSSGGTLTNCILYNNTTPANSNNPSRVELYKAGTSTVLNVSYCIIRDYSAAALNNYTSGSGITANGGANPSLRDVSNPIGPDGLWRTADDGLAIACASVAKDAGSATATANDSDIISNRRSGTIDIGAYEAQGGTAGVSALPATTTQVAITQTANATASYTDCAAQVVQVASAGASPVAGSVVAKVYILPSVPTTGDGQPYVARTYDITPATNAATATATITLYFTQADFDAYNAARGSYPSLPLDGTDAANYQANLRITQQHGTSTTGMLGSYSGSSVLITPTSVTYNATAQRWEVNFPITGFSGFFAHTGMVSPLPLHLLSFNGRVKGSTNELEWTVGGEEPGTVYVVERGTNGADFKAIAQVIGGGKVSYTYSDESANSTVYYRLRCTAVDGKEAYSAVVMVRRSSLSAGIVTVAPQPVHSALTITNTDVVLNGSTAIILDMQGREVACLTLSTSATLDTSNWVPGIYMLRLATGEVQRIVKQ